MSNRQACIIHKKPLSSALLQAGKFVAVWECDICAFLSLLTRSLSLTHRWCWWNGADNPMWSVQVSSHVLEGWTYVTLILTLLLQWVHTLSAWHKGHAGLLDLIFYSVSQHTISQSAAGDPCNLNIGSEQCVGFCWWGQVRDLMVEFNSASMYCTPAIHLEIYKVPQDRKKYRHSFYLQGAYIIIM